MFHTSSSRADAMVRLQDVSKTYQMGEVTASGSEPLPGEMQAAYSTGFAKIRSRGVQQKDMKPIVDFAEGKLAEGLRVQPKEVVK